MNHQEQIQGMSDKQLQAAADRAKNTTTSSERAGEFLYHLKKAIENEQERRIWEAERARITEAVLGPPPVSTPF